MLKKKLDAPDLVTPSLIPQNQDPKGASNLTEAERNENLIKALAHISDLDIENEAESQKIEPTSVKPMLSNDAVLTVPKVSQVHRFFSSNSNNNSQIFNQ